MPDSTLLQSNTAAGQAGAQGAGGDGATNSPSLSPTTLKPRQRAITDVAHIFRIVGSLQQSRRLQNEKNGRIQGKLNSERPHDDAELKSEGLGYKSNFSTKPLSTAIGKVASRLTKAIQSAKYLTSSELPDSIPDAKLKTELFRREITNCIRRWPGWFTFVNDVAAEDSTFGWTTVCWFDKSTWHPEHYRQDRAFLPDAIRQGENSFEFGAFLQYVFPHQLVEFIRDREAAEAAGWNIDNTVDSINNARPPTIPSAQAAPYTDFRRYEDAIRESSATLSLLNGAKQVMLWHVLAVEADGKVSYYVADGNSQKLLYEGEDRFENVREALALLSYEQGNGTLMGSKGIGREIYELANIIDRSRNETVDRLQFSGKIFVACDESIIDRFKLSVVGNVAIIPKGYEVLQTKIESGIQEFIELDQVMTLIMDQVAGSVSPRQYDRERVTATEINKSSEREEEKRDDVTTRFVQLFGNNVVGTIQRRICSDECTDADAKAVRKKLLQYMPPEELEQLAEQPALQTIEDYTQSDAERLLVFAESKRQDPLYNQYKLQRRAASASFSAEFADDVLLVQNDPTDVAEQTRTQLTESDLTMKGKDVPVSPRDNHLVHIEVLKQDLAPIVQRAAQLDQQAAQLAGLFLKHWGEHVNFALQGAAKDQMKDEVKELTQVGKQLGEIMAQIEHAQAAQAAGHSPAAAAGSAMGLSAENEPGEPAPELQPATDAG